MGIRGTRETRPSVLPSVAKSAMSCLRRLEGDAVLYLVPRLVARPHAAAEVRCVDEGPFGARGDDASRHGGGDAGNGGKLAFVRLVDVKRPDNADDIGACEPKPPFQHTPPHPQLTPSRPTPR